jgi:hypothetical protein
MTRPLFCAALLFSAVASAQDGGTAAPAPKNPKAPVDAGATDAGVAALQPKPVFAIAKSSLVLEQWAKTKPEARGSVPTLKAVKIGERAYLGIYLDNWELPFSRKVDLSGDILITDCTKRVLLEKAHVASAKTVDPKLQFAVPLNPTVELLYGLTDPECAYNVRLIIYDLVRGQSWASDGTFTVTR